METSLIILIFVLVLLFVLVGILVVCLLSGQGCTISVQQRTPNRDLTEQRQVEEEKKQKKLSSKVKRAFGSSSKVEQPVQPVDDVKKWDLTLKLHSDEKESEETTTINEKTTDPLRRKALTQAELDARLKRREEIRRKYEL